MADPITDGFSALAELLDEIEEIGIIAQIGVSLGLTLFALVFSRYIILKAAWRGASGTQPTGARHGRRRALCPTLSRCRSSSRDRAAATQGALRD